MRWWTAVIGFGILLVSCSPTADPVSTTTTIPAETTTTVAQSNEICLSGDLPFDTDGPIAVLGDDAGDATTLSRVQWDRSSNCERVTLAFGTATGAPATTLGPTLISVIPHAGIVRITLPEELVATSVADTLIEGSLIASVYTIRNDLGTITVDIHGVDATPIAARAFTVTSPATLVIDVTRAGTEAAPVGVATSQSAVVVVPAPGIVTYPIHVEGYAAPGLGDVEIRLLVDGNTIVRQTVALPGDRDTWQHFEATIDDGPRDSVLLFAGTLDDADQHVVGSLVSITVE